MSNFEDAKDAQTRLTAISQYEDGEVLADMSRQLRSLSPGEIAQLIQSAPPKLRRAIWDLALMDERSGQLLQLLDDEVRSSLLTDMAAQDIAAAASDIDTDEFADILQQLPETIAAEVLGFVDTQNRRFLETVLNYSPDVAGGLMNTDVITVRSRNALELVQRYLRRFERLPDVTDSVFVVNNRDEFVGVLPLARILTSDPRLTVREVMDAEIEPIGHLTSAEEVARRFTREKLITAPVVGDDGRLLGRITIDDVVEVIVDETEQSLSGLSRVDVEDDMFAPLPQTIRNRGIWLGVNLLTALIAAAVIHQFEEVIAKVVALAVLMPVVASMSGIAGTQVLTLIVRGNALGHIGPANLGWLARREVLGGLFQGLLWAVVVAIGAILIFQDLRLSLTLMIAMTVSILAAVVSGLLLPNLMRALRIDPAIAGVVVLTTVTDVVGFASFLGLATALYGP